MRIYLKPGETLEVVVVGVRQPHQPPNLFEKTFAFYAQPNGMFPEIGGTPGRLHVMNGNNEEIFNEEF